MTMEIDGNQWLDADEIDRHQKQQASKHSGPSTKQFSEVSHRDAPHLLKEYALLDEVVGTVGGGKEATVYIGIKDEVPLVAKIFKFFSGTNVKRLRGTHRLTEMDMAAIMAKREFWVLKDLETAGVTAPRPVAHVNNCMTMQLIGDAHEKPPVAPRLSEVDLRNYGDPYDFLDQILEEIETMFKNAAVVHGDFSQFNLLFYDSKSWVIDVSQGQLVNMKTFQPTPVRVRIDTAFKILEKDVQTILKHFEKKYRLKLDINDVLEIILEDVPETLQRRLPFFNNDDFREGFYGGGQNVLEGLWQYGEFGSQLYRRQGMTEKAYKAMVEKDGVKIQRKSEKW